MAIIYSYPLTTPKVKDLLIGTSVFDEDDENSPRNNPTVSFTIKSLLDMIGTGGFQTLQQVTNLGASTTNAITIANGLSVTGTFTDSTGGVGTAGQVLSSTNIGTAWVNDNAGLNYYVTGGSFDDQTGILAITGNDALVGASIDLDGRYLTANQTITLSGDVSGSGETAITTTLATVNTNIGAFTNANITVNAKGLVTAAASGTDETYDLNAGAKVSTSVPINLTSTSGTDNSLVNLKEGTNITLTRGSATEITIAATDTNTEYTGGRGITLNTLEFDVNVDATASAVPENLSTTASQTYKVQLDDQSENLVVNVPWVSGGGSVTGSGTLNKVPRWTATGSDLGDGPITFSNATASATSTFGGDIYSDEHAEADYFVATGANTTNSADKIVMEFFQSSQGGHSIYGLTTSNLAQYLIKLKSSDASLSSNALLLTGTLAQFGTGRITIGNQDVNSRLISMGYQQQWEFYQNSQTNLQFRKGTATTLPIYEVSTGGDFILNQYGSGTKTGTPTYNLSVDSTGNVIETPASQTGASLVYTQAYTAANLFTGGTQTFNVTGGVPVGKQLLIENLVYYLDYGGTSFDYINTDEIKINYSDGWSTVIGPKISNVDTFMNTTKDAMTEGIFAFSGSIFPHLLGEVVVGASPGFFDLVLPTARPTVGNGTLYVSMQYKLLDTGTSFSL